MKKASLRGLISKWIAGLAAFLLISIIGVSGGAAAYTVGGTVSGLEGSGLTLSLNGSDNLAVSADGSFTFEGSVADGSDYAVTVATQPSLPDQWCNVYNSSGTVSGANVADISVVCTTGLYSVVDTHQTACYDSTTGDPKACTGVGYDADYQGNQPSYTLSSDGLMVTDNITGLIWTAKVDINGDGVVDVNDKLTQPEAVTYCSGLTYGGYTWRLPSIKELYSLMDFRGSDPSSFTGNDTSVLTPFINDTYFQRAYGDTDAGERVIDGQYATATFYVSPLGTIYGADTMFGVNFADGRIKGYPYDEPPNNPKTFYVHCVTGNTSYGINDFVDNGDVTVSDLATGLMWQQNDYQSTNFEDAVAYCESATTADYDDWRLPNAKELQSIVDYSRAPDYSDSPALDPVFNATSFTNEEGQKDWGYYWSSTTHVTYPDNGTDAAYVSFGRALGYFDNAVTDVHGAGAQRTDGKMSITPQASTANVGYGTFYYFGPQGDIRRLDNFVRCVRDDNRSEQTITFGALSDKIQGDPDFTVSAIASSDLTVSFFSSTTDVCTVSGSTVSLVGVGTCTIVASQSGNGSYYPAYDVSQSFTVWADSDGDSVPDYADPYPNDPNYWNVGSICGSDNGQTLSSMPTKLCAAGNASAVTGDGPWTWTCSGITGGPDASCTAYTSFCSDGPVELNSNSTEYGSFKDALSHVSTNDTILIGPIAVPQEDVNIDASGHSLIFQGGWDCNFGNRTGTGSTVQGSITITSGTVEMDEVTIK